MAIKRRYSKKQIKAIGLQQALRAIMAANRDGLYLPDYFIADTHYNSPNRDEYPYRAEVANVMVEIEISLRKRLSNLSGVW